MLACPPHQLRLEHRARLPPDKLRLVLVRTAGFEPALPNGKRILSPQRLPFRHVRSLATATVVTAGLFRGDFLEV